MTVESGRLPAEGVQRMFDRIAPVYDAMNRVMTAGLDQRWRRATVEAAVREGDHVLDACCGTGDLAVAAWKAGAGHVVGLDFSGQMLERARRKAPELEWVQGDVLALPFEDASFDSAVVGFGVILAIYFWILVASGTIVWAASLSPPLAVRRSVRVSVRDEHLQQDDDSS